MLLRRETVKQTRECEALTETSCPVSGPEYREVERPSVQLVHYPTHITAHPNDFRTCVDHVVIISPGWIWLNISRLLQGEPRLLSVEEVLQRHGKRVLCLWHWEYKALFGTS